MTSNAIVYIVYCVNSVEIVVCNTMYIDLVKEVLLNTNEQHYHYSTSMMTSIYLPRYTLDYSTRCHCMHLLFKLNAYW